MANLVAVLSAKQDNFSSGFDGALKTVEKFEKTVAGSASSLVSHTKKINDAFKDLSGDKLIASANALASAVEKVGGASRLTEVEQAKVNRTLDEAIKKYQALGQTAPKHLTDLLAATTKIGQTAPKALGDLADGLGKIEQKAGLASKVGDTLASTFSKFTLAGVASAAILKVVGAISEFASNAQKFGGIENSFRQLSAAAQQSGQEMLTALRTGTRGLVEDMNLMQGANKAMLLGLPVTSKEMGELAKTATTLGRAMGQDATKSLDDLITALGRSSPLILDNLGLTVKVEEANEKYAKSLGRSAQSLTDAEKKTAFYVAAMEAARKKTAELGDQTLTLGERVTVAWNRISNNVTGALSDINIVLGHAAESWSNFFKFIGDAAKFKSFAELAASLRAPAARPQPFIDPAALARAATGARDFAKELRDTQTVVDGLTKSMRTQLDAAIKLGVKEEDITKQFGLSAVEQKLYAATLKETTKNTKELGQQADEMVARVTKEAAARAKATTILFDANRAVVAHIKSQRDLADMMDGMLMPYATWVQSLTHARDRVAVMVPGLAAMNDQLARQQSEIRGVIAQSERAFTEDLLKGLNFGQRLAQNIIGAFQGGGDIGKSIGAFLGNEIGESLGKSLAKKLATSLGESIGGAIGGLLGPLGALAGSLLGKVFDKIGGGPSPDELLGRQVVESFEQQLQGALSAATKLAAGNESWKLTTIAVRDAYVAAGRSSAEAEAAVRKLWDSSKKGADASRLAVLEIQAVMDIAADKQKELGQQTEANAKAVEDATAGVRTRISELTSEYDSLFKSIQNEAPEEVMGIIEANTRARMEAVAKERGEQESELKRITDAMEDSFDAVADAAAHAADLIRQAFEDMLPGREIRTSVPVLGSGGVATRPTLALVGDVPEAIIPLSQAGLVSGDDEAMLGELRGLRAEQRRLPDVIFRAFRDAKALAG